MKHKKEKRKWGIETNNVLRENNLTGTIERKGIVEKRKLF
jgi:hypothetical protein